MRGVILLNRSGDSTKSLGATALKLEL